MQPKDPYRHHNSRPLPDNPIGAIIPTMFRTILAAGLISGITDITAAFVVWGIRAHVGPMRILQSVASGLLGAGSYSGGVKSAAIGLVLHFFIATCAAAVFYAISRVWRFLTDQVVISGFVYGIAVHLFMQFIVIPRSASPMRNGTFSWTPFLIGTAIHMFCVGLPIALIVRQCSRRAS